MGCSMDLPAVSHRTTHMGCSMVSPAVSHVQQRGAYGFHVSWSTPVFRI